MFGSSKGEERVLSISEKAVPAGSYKPVAAKSVTQPVLENTEVSLSEGSVEKDDGTLETTEEMDGGSIDTTVQGGSMLPSRGKAESGLYPTESNTSPRAGEISVTEDIVPSVKCQGFAAKQKARPHSREHKEMCPGGNSRKGVGEKCFFVVVVFF